MTDLAFTHLHRIAMRRTANSLQIQQFIYKNCIELNRFISIRMGVFVFQVHPIARIFQKRRKIFSF